MDTNGAGDAFVGGFLSQIVLGKVRLGFKRVFRFEIDVHIRDSLDISMKGETCALKPQAGGCVHENRVLFGLMRSAVDLIQRCVCVYVERESIKFFIMMGAGRERGDPGW